MIKYEIIMVLTRGTHPQMFVAEAPDIVTVMMEAAAHHVDIARGGWAVAHERSQ